MDIKLEDLSSSKIENEYVLKVYEQIASHFDSTRYLIWPKIREYVSQIPAGNLIVEVGCGNGKNLCYNKGCYHLGIDICSSMINICSSKSTGEFCLANNLNLPLRTNTFDHVLSIAVLHHFSSIERRVKALKELIRITKRGGAILIYVWSYEANEHKYKDQDAFVKWELQKKHQLKISTEGPPIFYRYYHFFKKGEIEELVSSIGETIVNSGFDHENWFYIIRKK